MNKKLSIIMTDEDAEIKIDKEAQVTTKLIVIKDFDIMKFLKDMIILYDKLILEKDNQVIQSQNGN